MRVLSLLRYPYVEKLKSNRAAIGFVVLQGSILGMIVVGLLILITVILRPYSIQSPITIVGNSKAELGNVCPGDAIPVLLTVEVHAPIIATYLISVRDPSRRFTYADTPVFFMGYVYEETGIYTQPIIWTVPELRPGNYIRTSAARGTDGGRDFSRINQTFIIREDCNVQVFVEPDPQHRSTQDGGADWDCLGCLDGVLADDP